MREISIAITPWSRKLLRLIGWAALVLASSAVLPVPLHVLIRLADWITSLFPHLSRFREDSPWSY